MARVNIISQAKTATGWRNFALKRDPKGRIKWGSGHCRYLIEWRQNGRRLREAAGVTPSEALEAQRTKHLELEATRSGLRLLGLPEKTDQQLSLSKAVEAFLRDIKTFRKKPTHQKYEHILGLLQEFVAPNDDARQVTPQDIKEFLTWRKSKGFDPGTTLYTDRIILNNFFNTLKIENPVKQVPKLTRFRKKPVACSDVELAAFFAACDDWERAFFALALATGLRRGELQTLHWSDLDLAHGRVHVTAKPEYNFLPKDWKERSVPIPLKVSKLMRKHPHIQGCPLVFPSPTGKPNYHFLHDRCKEIAKRAGLDPKDWHLHRFRDTCATRWLRGGVDVRTVQVWLGHESLATTQKYLEPSKETQQKLDELPQPF